YSYTILHVDLRRPDSGEKMKGTSGPFGRSCRRSTEANLRQSTSARCAFSTHAHAGLGRDLWNRPPQVLQISRVMPPLCTGILFAYPSRLLDLKFPRGR